MFIIIGTLISISSSSWFRIWIGLEINLLSFIPLIIRSKNLFSSESSLKYFLTQVLASAIFFFSIILIFLFINFKIDLIHYNFIIISSTIIIKRGIAPFHFWLPSVIEGLNWFSIFFLITWQKIAPLIILSYRIRLNLIICVIFFSIIFGRLGGINQTSLRKIIAYSSINHLGWIIAGIINNENLWIIYFIFYIFLNFCIIYIFNNFKLLNINQTFKLFYSNKIINISIFVIILSLGGLPPFIGFIPKWFIIELLVINKIYFILFFILTITLITLYFYLRITFAAFLLNHLIINWTFKINIFKKNIKTISILNFFSISGIVLINNFYYFF